jgi:predicted HicB family RNase H-like nuclease
MKDILKYNDFISSIHYSTEDEVFHGKIQGIDDSITFEGSSVSALKKAFKEAIEDYLSICEEAGKDPLKSYKGSFNIRIQPELHKKAAFKSIELGISLNQFVEKAISNFMSKKTGSSK